MFALVPVLALWLIARVDGSTMAIAQFNAANTGLEGKISALNGFIWVDLDFSSVDWSSMPANCTEGGLKYHIHEKWTWGDTTLSSAVDRMLDDCGYDYTGNHFDPWFACGSASSNPDCELNGGCIPSSSVWGSTNFDGEYWCTEQNYSTVAYTCEVGDWSGKYGPLPIVPGVNDTVDRIDGSYWEVSVAKLAPNQNTENPYSLVIHCGDGTRAFCAAILRGNNQEVSKDLSDNQVIEVDFSDAGNAFTNFTVKFTKEGTTFTFNKDSGFLDACSEYSMYLYDSYYIATAGKTASVDCDTSLLGGIYDPTAQCINDSSSEYCDGTTRCPGSSNTSVSYSCTIDDDYFGCATGDIAGRVGTINFNGASGSFSINDPKSPPLFTLADKTLLLRCESASENSTIDNVCAITVQTNGTRVTLEPVTYTTMDDDDAAFSVNIMGSAVGIAVAMIVAFVGIATV